MPLPTRRRLRYLYRRHRYVSRARRQRRRTKLYQWVGPDFKQVRRPLGAVYLIGPWQTVYHKRVPADPPFRPWLMTNAVRTGYPVGGAVRVEPPRLVWVLPHLTWEGPNSHAKRSALGQVPWPVKVHGRKLNPKTTGKRKDRAIKYARSIFGRLGEWPAWAPVDWMP